MKTKTVEINRLKELFRGRVSEVGRGREDLSMSRLVLEVFEASEIPLEATDLQTILGDPRGRGIVGHLKTQGWIGPSAKQTPRRRPYVWELTEAGREKLKGYRQPQSQPVSSRVPLRKRFMIADTTDVLAAVEHRIEELEAAVKTLTEERDTWRKLAEEAEAKLNNVESQIHTEHAFNSKFGHLLRKN